MATDAVANGHSGTTDALATWLSIVAKDYTKVGVRIRTVNHTIVCAHKNTNIRAHYPALRGSRPTINDLLDLLDLYMVNFALPRAEVRAVHEQYGTIDAEEYDILRDKLRLRARDLFIKANKATNRNGEAGELLLYLFTEWALEAPQLLAKMSLKTNRNMPVYGSDGIHVRYCDKSQTIEFLWGESKLHQDINSAVSSAVSSISKALLETEIDFELSLVSRNIDFSGMKDDAKSILLKFLDPMEEDSNRRLNVITCLIGFDFKAYEGLAKIDPDKSDAAITVEIESALKKSATKLANALTSAKLEDEKIEIFFFPVPSVSDMRDSFQEKIGWTK